MNCSKLLRILRAATSSDWTAFAFPKTNLLHYIKFNWRSQQPRHRRGQTHPSSAGRSHEQVNLKKGDADFQQPVKVKLAANIRF